MRRSCRADLLACAAARLGDPQAALEAAVKRGFAAVEHLRTDEDLASLRDRDGFRRLIERLEGAPVG